MIFLSSSLDWAQKTEIWENKTVLGNLTFASFCQFFRIPSVGFGVSIMAQFSLSPSVFFVDIPLQSKDYQEKLKFLDMSTSCIHEKYLGKLSKSSAFLHKIIKAHFLILHVYNFSGCIIFCLQVYHYLRYPFYYWVYITIGCMCCGFFVCF